MSERDKERLLPETLLFRGSPEKNPRMLFKTVSQKSRRVTDT
ncbi:hypothetical protein [Saccharibacillus alkalitolerans]|nr:hypothetical protein [Saccharibacillus alkalitolerans]